MALLLLCVVIVVVGVFVFLQKEKYVTSSLSFLLQVVLEQLCIDLLEQKKKKENG